MSTAAKNIYQLGSTDIPVPSTISGQNVNQSCLQWKNFSPLTLSSAKATSLPDCPCMNVKITNQLGNDQIAIGGLSGSNDLPYFFPNNPGLARGTVIPPGQSHIFKVTNSNLLTAIALRDKDIITCQACLSMSNFNTSTSDPPANPVTTLGAPMVINLVPANNSVGFAIANNVVATMSPAVLNSLVTSANVFLVKHSDLSLVPSVVTVSTDGKTITLNPTGSLLTSTQYDFMIQNLTNRASPPTTQSPNPFFSTFQTAGNITTRNVSSAVGAVTDAVARRAFRFRTVAESLGSVTESIAQLSTKLVYNVAQDNVTVGPSACAPVTGGGYSCYVNTAGFYAVGEFATVGNGLTSGPVTKVIVANVKTQGSSGNVGCQIVNSSGTSVYTFANPVNIGTGTTANVTLQDNGNTYTMAVGDAVMVTWDQGALNGLAISINSGSTYDEVTNWNGSTFTSAGTQHGNSAKIDLAAKIYTLS